MRSTVPPGATVPDAGLMMAVKVTVGGLFGLWGLTRPRQRGRGADQIGRRWRDDRQQLVVPVGDFLHQKTVQPHERVRVVFLDVADLAALGVKPAEAATVHIGVDIGIGDGLRQFVRRDGRQLVDGGPRLRQDAVARGASGGDDDGIAYRRPVRADEGGVIAKDALLSRALPAAEVYRDIGLDIDDIQGVGIRGLEKAAADVGLKARSDERVADRRAGGDRRVIDRAGHRRPRPDTVTSAPRACRYAPLVMSFRNALSVAVSAFAGADENS